jgi:hypothetical protein
MTCTHSNPMLRTRSRRLLTPLTAAAVLASLSPATATSPASAAKATCQGKLATIVGTNKSERIIGTNRRDVIVAKAGNDRVYGRGGNDLICGGPGNDRLFGGGGPDRLFGGAADDFLAGQTGPDVLGGGPGDDKLDGGVGVDLCTQNGGSGPMVRCELPRSSFDSDGDGITDDKDRCPNAGDAGFGLDGDGCPIARFENGFHAKCVADGGTNSDPGSAYRCDWAGESPVLLPDTYLGVCSNGPSRQASPAFIECYELV